MKRQCIILLILLLPLFVSAQLDYNKDAALWLHVNLQKKLNKKNELYLNFQGRLDQNWSRFTRFSTEIGYSRSLHRNLEINAGYVFIQRAEWQGYISYRNRFYLSGIVKADFGRWNIRLRAALQSTYKDYLNSEDGELARLYNRNRLTLRYDINKRLRAYAATELFLPLSHKPPKTFSQWRLAGGLSYKLSKQSELYTYYMLRQELESFNQPYQSYVTGIGYEFKF